MGELGEGSPGIVRGDFPQASLTGVADDRLKHRLSCDRTGLDPSGPIRMPQLRPGADPDPVSCGAIERWPPAQYVTRPARRVQASKTSSASPHGTCTIGSARLSNGFASSS